MRIRPILQTETAECSLACLAMIANAYGMRVGIRELRNQFSVSTKGATLRTLISYSGALGFSARPVRIELDEISSLKTPAILHWQLNHFLVLVKSSSKRITVMDPAIGERKLSRHEFSAGFTGVALELTPNTEFQPERTATRLRVSQLTGSVRGLPLALLRIFLVALALEIFSLAAPLFNQLIVDEVLTSGDRELLNIIILGFGLLLITQSAVAFARSWMVMVLAQTISLQ